MGVIYLVRHGQAESTAYGIAADAPSGPTGVAGGLTDTGLVQAQITGAMLAGQIDRLTGAVSGDLPRQTQTLATVLGQFDAAPAPVVDADWNEYALPALVGEATAAEYADGRAYQQRLDAGLADWITADGHHADGASDSLGGETYGAFRGRVTAAAQRAIEMTGSGQTTIVVSSAGTITQWIAALWGIPAPQWPTLSRTMVNASITKLIVGRSGVTVVSVNEHLHLADRDGGVATYR